MFPSLNAIEIQRPVVDIEEQNESDLLLDPSRQSHLISENWSLQVAAAIEHASLIDPYQKDIPVGTVIPAARAVGWINGQGSCDVRPRLLDKSSGVSRLLDTGSQVTTTSKGPGDKRDVVSRLIAVNGTKINTYGVKEIEVKINRKSYKIQAVVCEVGQEILGMDFMNKYKLGFEWDEFDQLFIVDKKADIRARLEIVTVPPDLLRNRRADAQSLSQEIQPQSEDVGALASTRSQDQVAAMNQAIAFQVACIKKLSEPEIKKKSIEDQLSMHDEKYVRLMRKYPQLLNPSFKKGEPAHGVWHKIETGSHQPCKSKRRPIIANSAKAAAGKAAWEQMARDGIIERVPAGEPTDWTSSLHIADKAGGGARPCSDFRLLNQRTETDAYPLPLLKNFTNKIHGCEVFSVIDLKSAFFNVPIWPPHRHKTTTLDPWGGVWRYNRLPSVCPLGQVPGSAYWRPF